MPWSKLLYAREEGGGGEGRGGTGCIDERSASTSFCWCFPVYLTVASGNSMWYSFNYANVHFVSFGTYMQHAAAFNTCVVHLHSHSSTPTLCRRLPSPHTPHSHASSHNPHHTHRTHSHTHTHTPSHTPHTHAVSPHTLTTHTPPPHPSLTHTLTHSPPTHSHSYASHTTHTPSHSHPPCALPTLTRHGDGLRDVACLRRGR
jgi:hypothetical protein